MAGKNKVERSFRILFDDSGGSAQDISSDLIPGSITGGGLTFDQVDMTGVSEDIYNYLKGHASSQVTAQFHMNDTATTGAYTVLTGHNTGAGTGTLTLQWGQSGAAPTTGDPEWEGEYVLIDCSAAMNGGKAVLNATWQPNSATLPAWGTVA